MNYFVTCVCHMLFLFIPIVSEQKREGGNGNKRQGEECVRLVPNPNPNPRPSPAYGASPAYQAGGGGAGGRAGASPMYQATSPAWCVFRCVFFFFVWGGSYPSSGRRTRTLLRVFFRRRCRRQRRRQIISFLSLSRALLPPSSSPSPFLSLSASSSRSTLTDLFPSKLHAQNRF